MIGLSHDVRIWLCVGHTDMRKGFDGLSANALHVSEKVPFNGHVFVFPAKRGDRAKLLWWDGQGLCLYYKSLEQGRFVWPSAQSGVVHLSHAQLSMLLEGIDWRPPARRYRPQHSA